jgi:sarcosine oxidase subunit alpha
MARRVASLQRPVRFELDGEPVMAEEGEPLVFALIAADKLALSRSPKLHRPHGPYCLRGACDGCLARVDGEPNVMTCMKPCRGGERIETQNVFGSREIDLLAVTDWFFPHGIDHHHLLAGVPAAGSFMQKLARHVAGLGRLPDEADEGAPPPRPPEAAVRTVDVLIVGAGPAGLTVARALATESPGLGILVVDDGPLPGGSLRARGRDVPPAAGFEISCSATAGGVYGREVLVVGEDRALVVQPRVLVLATGVHDGTRAFPGNDLPGVVSARAAALLAQHGIAIGEKVALVGDGPYAQAFLEKLGDVIDVVRVPADMPVSAGGRLRVASVVVGSGRGKRHRVDALVLDLPGHPAFELASAGGARIVLDRDKGGYLPVVDVDGRAGDTLFCAGELAGTGPSLTAITEQATRVAKGVARAFTPR